ncbi:hypothetical protein ABV23_RS00500 [Escherichia coli]|nr:hypothetical protein [Escherichia coli]
MTISIAQSNFENEIIAQALRLNDGRAEINYGFNSGGCENYQYFVTADGGVLGINTVIVNIQKINFNDPDDSQFFITGVDVNYEDDYLTDDHTGEALESAYAERENDDDRLDFFPNGLQD